MPMAASTSTATRRRPLPEPGQPGVHPRRQPLSTSALAGRRGLSRPVATTGDGTSARPTTSGKRQPLQERRASPQQPDAGSPDDSSKPMTSSRPSAGAVTGRPSGRDQLVVEQIDRQAGRHGRHDHEPAGAVELPRHRPGQVQVPCSAQADGHVSQRSRSWTRIAIATAVRIAETRMPRLRGQGADPRRIGQENQIQRPDRRPGQLETPGFARLA